MNALSAYDGPTAARYSISLFFEHVFVSFERRQNSLVQVSVAPFHLCSTVLSGTLAAPFLEAQPRFFSTIAKCAQPAIPSLLLPISAANRLLQFGIENRVHLRLALVEIGISCENCMIATPRELRHPIDILGTKIARFADGRNLPARTQCYLPYRIHNVERYVFIGPNSQAANAHSK